MALRARPPPLARSPTTLLVGAALIGVTRLVARQDAPGFAAPLVAGQAPAMNRVHMRGARVAAVPKEGDEQVGGKPQQLEQEFFERDPGAWRRQELLRIAAFAGPALSVPLADPLMTLIDTACVGRAAGTSQLAALGPNTVLFNFMNYCVNFLGIATVGILARELAAGSRAQAARSLSHALSLALLLGGAMLVLVQWQAAGFLALAGAVQGGAFFAPALQYLRIRALSLPAFTSMVVLQSALLAQQESRAPGLAVLLAAAVNATGDVLLVVGMGMGAAGAAWATVVGEVAAAAMLLLVLPRNGRLPRGMRLPSLPELRPFAAVLGPLAVFKVTKNLCYGLLQSTATAMGAVVCAAHQSVWVLWTFLSFVGEPLSQAAQALLPERVLAARNGGAHQRRLLGETMRLLLGASLAVGLLLGCAAGLLPAFAPQLFSPDTALWRQMAAVAVPSAAAAVLSTLSCPVEGALLARGEVPFMAACMCFILLVLAVGVRGIRTGAYGQQGLAAVWWWLVAFFGMRIVTMGAQLRRKQGRSPSD